MIETPPAWRTASCRSVGTSSIVSESISRKQWLYEIETWKEHPELGHAFNFQMIVDATGQTAGFVATDAGRRDKGLGVWLLEFVEGIHGCTYFALSGPPPGSPLLYATKAVRHFVYSRGGLTPYSC